MEGIGRTGPAGVAGLYRAVEKKTGESSEGSFGDLIKQAVSEVNQAQKEADSSIQKLATGNSQDIHQTMIAMEKADVSFKMLMQVRDKIVAAQRNPAETSVRAIMSGPIVTAHPDWTLIECSRVMQENRIHHLPVTDEQGALVGMISATDIFMSVEEQGWEEDE